MNVAPLGLPGKPLIDKKRPACQTVAADLHPMYLYEKGGRLLL